MWNLGDKNDLYNAQEVIPFCKIIENRFQLIHEKYGFNSRKCNSAIEIDLSKLIIALPTTNEIVNAFEQNLTGRFTYDNTSCFWHWNFTA